jgi:hypothetical protein
MRLLLVFLTSLLVGQSISVGVGLLVERHATPYTGLVTFIVCYFAMFWVAWRFAVRVTEPRAHVRERGEPSAVLLGAYAAADDLWTQSTLCYFSNVPAERRSATRSDAWTSPGGSSFSWGCSRSW